MKLVAHAREVLVKRLVPSVLFAAALFVPRAAHAQLPVPSLALVGGVSNYDLSGTGSTAFGAVRVDVPLLAVIAEGSLGMMRPKEQDGTRTYVIPEVQLQYQLFPLLVRPYLGVGGGVFKAIAGPDPQRSDFTLSAAAGVRATIPLIGFGVRAEARVRGIGSGFSGSSTELTVGVSF
jgi:hypothetical protein